jgi:methylthioribose-1-phosphate isomerase
MLVKNKNYRTIWIDSENPKIINAIDQNLLPYKFRIMKLKTVNDIIKSIKNMSVRGAPLIGAAAAFGIYLATIEAGKKFNDVKSFSNYIIKKAKELIYARPTAINLKWAVGRTLKSIDEIKGIDNKIQTALNTAKKIAEEDIKSCKKIGEYGYKILKEISKKKKGDKINILTHCNAGWLACIDWGTATAPIYLAHQRGLKLHVWVEETRPRNQGAKLTAWELGQTGIPHTIITDNVGGYVMQKGMVDIVIVGSDRTTKKGDVCNKIGTYKTALAAKDNGIPFYAALPLSSFDLSIKDGMKEIQIEERNQEEVLYMEGRVRNKIEKILVASPGSKAKNYGFDITPARLVTGLITPVGVIEPNEKSIVRTIKN